MEKEEKILRESKHSFYARLSVFYGPFALCYISILRLLCTTQFKFNAVAYAYVFPLCCLQIHSFIWTIAAVNFS